MVLTYIADHWTRWSEPTPHVACLDSLPSDILVDFVFFYINVEDIIAMRRVSRLYYALSHHPAIWKRLLRTMPFPLPPLPPTSSFNMDNLSGLEAERLISRAYSLEDNWRREQPRAHRARTFPAWWDVLYIALAPGGHYMVASTCTRGGDHYALMLYSMDHPSLVAVPLTRLKTANKAYCLSIRYMPYLGEQGIMISFIKRSCYYRGHWTTVGVDPDVFSANHPIDAPVPLRYELEAYHIPLSALEHLETQTPYDHPWRLAARLDSKTELKKAVLEEIKGEPYLVCIVGQDAIMFKNLATGKKSTLKCHRWDNFPDLVQPIQTFRVIAEQNQILVIREIKDIPHQENRLYPFEIYWIPFDGKDYYHPIDRAFLDKFTEAKFFCPPSPNAPMFGSRTDASIQSSIRAFSDREPPPISIYGAIHGGMGSCHLTIWPRRVAMPKMPKTVDPPEVVPLPVGGSIKIDWRADGAMPWKRRYWYYPLHTMGFQSVFDFTGVPGIGRVEVAGGNERAIFTTFDPKDQSDQPPLLNLFRYASHDLRSATQATLQPWGDDEDKASMDVKRRIQLEQLRRPRPKTSVASLPIPKEFYAKLRCGVRAVAFDESTGRLCMSAYNDQTIYVTDFARAPIENKHGERMPLPIDFRHSFHDPLPVEIDLEIPGGLTPMNTD